MSTFVKPSERVVSCGDVSCEFLVDPIPRPKPPAIKVSTSPQHREIVFVDNHKPNSIAILRGAQAILRARGIPVREEVKLKLNASVTLDDAELAELASKGGLILCGISDCGSCSAASVRDAILLQQRGAAAIAVLTKPFESQMDRIATYYETDRPIPVVVLDHPMQNVGTAELRARSEALADAVEAIFNE
ncbi:UGSC family (seleno)protein [Nocardia sp. NPDC059240]|uniref:UGSC family (seleno)protein n=1 Tax=Nocardia sp. NPDC059240 TaxID=3346786 RepID=UPI00367B30F0